jgi:heterotetrameric sarcosine oxidase gamma subunit
VAETSAAPTTAAPATVAPVARSPIAQPEPVATVAGWEVHVGRSAAGLRLADHTPLAKVLVRAAPGGAVAAHLDVRFGRAARDRHGTLVVGCDPDGWLLLGPPGAEAGIAGRVRELADDGPVTVLEIFGHGRALVRLTGADAPRLLAKVCAIDLDDSFTPDGAAFRSSVAKVATDVVRDDVSGERSYLLHCERSSGQYLFDALMDAGEEFGIERDGFTGREN